jgi:4-amino-4-deoxy-L-arabinose transferase-like glycosyltransferase
MRVMTLAAIAPGRLWHWAVVAVIASATFLGCLGSVELWGKREQRASAESIDTIEHNHWLVAQIQGRPRLEKPPLLRWSIAALMTLTGRRDEWMVRLPGAVSALATVVLIFAWGRQMGGDAVGLASALVLCSMVFFVGEMRQASNDGPLVLFTTLALYAAWRRLHCQGGVQPVEDESRSPGRSAHASLWGMVFHASLALGFLTKGPVILLLVAVTVIPYLTFSRRLAWGLRRLAAGWSLPVFAALALSWPVAVLMQDPNALGVWTMEMSEKTGLSHILEHHRRALLVRQWPGMVLPWTLIGVVGLLLPFFAETANSRRDRAGPWQARSRAAAASLWFPWWWAVGSLAVFCFWAVAKPSYYVPCLPGMALLIGSAWDHLVRRARGRNGPALVARGILQAQWVLFFVAAALAPLAVRPWLAAALWPWSFAVALAFATAVVISVHAWRRGASALTLVPISAACVFGTLIVYGVIAPAENELHSHRALAQRLKRLVAPEARTIMFFNEIDEGLWFYLSGLDLTPVSGSHPRYNTAYDLAESYLTARRPGECLAEVEGRRQLRHKRALIDWLDHTDTRTAYLLIRGDFYDRFAAELSGRVTPVFRETGMKRNALVLLRGVGRRPPSGTAAATVPARH